MFTFAVTQVWNFPLPTVKEPSSPLCCDHLLLPVIPPRPDLCTHVFYSSSSQKFSFAFVILLASVWLFLLRPVPHLTTTAPQQEQQESIAPLEDDDNNIDHHHPHENDKEDLETTNVLFTNNSSTTDVPPLTDKEGSSSSSSSCQIIYVVGVEGTKHHGTTDFLSKLAGQQQQIHNNNNGKLVKVYLRDSRFRDIINWDGEQNVPLEMMEETMNKLCPSNDTIYHHILIEDRSFPCKFDKRKELVGKSLNEMDEWITKMNHPINLHEFAQTFQPYGNVKFVVLHRPFLNTVVSHGNGEFGETFIQHGEIIAAFLRYLGSVLTEIKTPSLWTMVCVDQLSNSIDNTTNGLARQAIIQNLVHHLNWNQTNCETCFTHWLDSTKGHPKEIIQDQDDYETLLELRKSLNGHWPPTTNDGELLCDGNLQI